MSRRTDRVGEQLREVVSELLTRKMQDPGLRDLRITEAVMSPDLREATLYVSVFPGDEARRAQATLALDRAAGFLRREVGRRMRLRSVPLLRFRIDLTADRAAHIEELLREAAPPPTADGETLDPGADPTEE